VVLESGSKPTTEGEEKIPRIPQSTAAKVEKAVLVGLDTSGGEDSLAELALLVDTAGAKVTARAVQRRASIDTSTFLSKGKREEVATFCCGMTPSCWFATRI